MTVYPHQFCLTGLYYFPADEAVAYDRIIYAIEVSPSRNKGILLITAFDKISVFTEIINKKLQEYIEKNRLVFDNGML